MFMFFMGLGGLTELPLQSHSPCKADKEKGVAIFMGKGQYQIIFNITRGSQCWFYLSE